MLHGDALAAENAKLKAAQVDGNLLIEVRACKGVPEQLEILVFNKRVGYCGARKGMPVNFLTASRGQCVLTDKEKVEVIQFVQRHHGGGDDAVKVSPAMKACIDACVNQG